MLTKKQHQLLAFIHQRTSIDGVSPSFDEMKDALNLKSKSGIHRLIKGLEERGFLSRLPNRARALEIIKLPNDLQTLPQPLASAKEKIASRPTATSKNVLAFPSHAAPEHPNATITLPLYGKIAAGSPIEAIHNHTDTIEAPTSMIGTGDHFALTVQGDSMIEAGILDGDTAIIQHCHSSPDGTIVVALVDDEDATLKTLYRKSGHVLLQPANKHHQTQIYAPEQVQIQGRLVGILRTYH
jgi:repressor LexA